MPLQQNDSMKQNQKTKKSSASPPNDCWVTKEESLRRCEDDDLYDGQQKWYEMNLGDRSVERFSGPADRPIRLFGGSKDMYYGEMKNGMPHGFGVLFNRSVGYEGLIYVGDWKDGLCHGNGSATWLECADAWEKNKTKHRRTPIIHLDGARRPYNYVGGYKNDSKHDAHGVVTFKNGKKLNSHWRNGTLLKLSEPQPLVASPLSASTSIPPQAMPSTAGAQGQKRRDNQDNTANPSSRAVRARMSTTDGPAGEGSAVAPPPPPPPAAAAASPAASHDIRASSITTDNRNEMGAGDNVVADQTQSTTLDVGPPPDPVMASFAPAERAVLMEAAAKYRRSLARDRESKALAAKLDAEAEKSKAEIAKLQAETAKVEAEAKIVRDNQLFEHLKKRQELRRMGTPQEEIDAAFPPV
ncbi:hypothetical protein MPSEU_000143700 [Mayamaea pseudoterrestris]|nr:hypothetical protein MPSEU_000143700 [Mayamaea pseudoterrestris]